MGRFGSSTGCKVLCSSDARRLEARLLEAGAVVAFHKRTPTFRLDGGAVLDPNLGEIGVADCVFAYQTPLLGEVIIQFLKKGTSRTAVENEITASTTALARMRYCVQYAATLLTVILD